MQKLPKVSLFEPKNKSTKRIAISKRRRRRRIKYSHIDLATDSEKKVKYVLKMCENGQKCYFVNEKNVKQKDSEYKISSPVGQMDCKNTKEKSKLLVKCFVDSVRKNPPISASNVPKLPGMSLFEPRKKSKKKDSDQENVKNIDKLLSN